MTSSLTQPETVSETLRLPLRAVVASCSVTRSSRSAQQSPPRSAAAAGVMPTAANPKAASNAQRLLDNLNTDFIGAPLFYRPQIINDALSPRAAGFSPYAHTAVKRCGQLRCLLT